MQIINTLNNITVPEGTALCLGNFDGYHLGHRLIIDTLKCEAHEKKLKSIIFTFDPHPLKFFGKIVTLLTTKRKRLELFGLTGVDYLVNAPFDEHLAKLTPDDFFKNILLDMFNVKVLVVGKDYHFGAGKSGDIVKMAQLGDKYGVRCIFVEKMKDSSGAEISSTRIRNYLQNGDVSSAAALLGRSYSLEGLIVHGDGKGRQFGFPTANIDTGCELIPLEGVYSTVCNICGKAYESMTYIGRRPSVTNCGELRVEVNIFKFDADIYGEFVELEFKKFIRGEMKFASIDELKKQMNSDLHSVELSFRKVLI